MIDTIEKTQSSEWRYGVYTDAVCGVIDLEPEPEPEPIPEVGEVESCKRLQTSDESSTEALEQVTDSSNADMADAHNNVSMTG